MRTDAKTKELIAVGASVTANCQPCLLYHTAKARQAGADDGDITLAIAVGKAVRKGASAKMDDFARGLSGELSPTEPESAHGCGCGA